MTPNPYTLLTTVSLAVCRFTVLVWRTHFSTYTRVLNSKNDAFIWEDPDSKIKQKYFWTVFPVSIHSLWLAIWERSNGERKTILQCTDWITSSLLGPVRRLLTKIQFWLESFQQRGDTKFLSRRPSVRYLGFKLTQAREIWSLIYKKAWLGWQCQRLTDNWEDL